MKFKILILLLIIFCRSLVAQDKGIDLLTYDFFGFKMNQTKSEIFKILKEKKIIYKTSIGKDLSNKNIETVLITPKNQDTFESINVDFTIYFYDNKILLISKYNIEKGYLYNLLKLVKNYREIKGENIDELIQCEYRTNKFNLIYQDLNIGDAKNQIILVNRDVELQVWENKVINKKSILYYVKTNNAKLYDYYNSEKKLIRNLEQNEKLEFLNFEDDENINDKAPKWIKVNTSYDEIGWVLESDLEKIEKK